MSDEYVDIVNEKDEIIGKELRSVILAKKLLGRVVHLLITNSKGKLLLQKRSMSVEVGAGQMTSSASGGVEPGESYDDAAKRELEEELGISLDIIFIGKYRMKTESNNCFGCVYTSVYDGSFQLDPKEIESVSFFEINALKKKIRTKPELFTPNFLEAFKVFIK